MPELIEKYFPGISEEQRKRFSMLKPVYDVWNSRINVISRKDLDNLYLHHVLHSLSVARVISFKPGTEVLDAGTGGGFPGIPLAILFPDVRFVMLDSILKKIKVVNEVINATGLRNAQAVRSRIEEHPGIYDFIICRAVSAFPEFVKLTKGKVRSGGTNSLLNGIIYLKGGDLTGELGAFGKQVRIWKIRDFFGESFFETKRIVYLAC